MPQMITPWLKQWTPRPQARLQLFCFPFAGGTSQIFRTWPADLPEAINVLAVELPGHGNRLREPLFTQVDMVVEAIATAMQPYLQQPYALFGHSLGTLFAFEVARLLKQQGYPEAAYLLVSGRGAPHLPYQAPPIHTLPDAAFVDAIRRYAGSPTAVLDNVDMRRVFLPILRADFTLLETYQYQPGPRLQCPIQAMSGRDDPHVDPQRLQAWAELTDGTFNCQFYPGNHFYLQAQQAELLAAIASLLMT